MVYVPENDADAVTYFLSPAAIRDRSRYLYDLALNDQLDHFAINLHQLHPVADYVLEVTREEYPDFDVPFHSRWRHFEVGNIQRLAQIEQKLADQSAIEQARSKFDLAIISVLLDAGAGSRWQYHEPGTYLVVKRSEGLALASYHMFCNGLFSSNPDLPLQADAKGLAQLTEAQLANGFQADEHNPLVGLSGRLLLLQKLGHVLRQHPDLFGYKQPRLGNLVDHLITQAKDKDQQISAVTVLQAILRGLGEIWPGRIEIANTNLGDTWQSNKLAGLDRRYPYIPFHKLSQWLTYSLLEPLQDLGYQITDLDQLTGLAEYRNAGLCLDMGLLVPKQPEILHQPQPLDSSVIIEWRATTIILLDQIAAVIRQKLNQTADQLPLVKVLQGGTWTAGRRIAAKRRPSGVPPIQLISDGTVF